MVSSYSSSSSNKILKTRLVFLKENRMCILIILLIAKVHISSCILTESKIFYEVRDMKLTVKRGLGGTFLAHVTFNQASMYHFVNIIVLTHAFYVRYISTFEPIFHFLILSQTALAEG